MNKSLELKEHQKRVAQRLQNPDKKGLLLYWNLGSGKTIGAINAANQVGGNATAVVPASLQENFKKEIVKTRSNPKDFNVMSYEKFTRNPDMTNNNLLILDEAHRIRSASSKRSKTIRDNAQFFNKKLLLTGTPIQNKPHEIAPLINTITGDDTFPLKEKEFNKRYIQQDLVVPTAWDRFVNGKLPYQITRVKNRKEFEHKIDGLVDYYNARDPKDYPEMHEYKVEVPMTKSQIDLHNYYERKLPRTLKKKMEQMLPPNKQEVAALSSFLSATRQLSNASDAFVKLQTGAPKIQTIADYVSKDSRPSLVYSNYLDSGLNPLAQELSKRKVNYGLFTGALSSEEKKKLVDSYNSGKIKTLLVSSSGGEGLDLKNTGSVHIMEPHWNDPKIEQVIGRAARYHSHINLPEDQRNVKVFKYVSKFPTPEPSVLKELGIKTDDSNRTTADQYLYNLSKQKHTTNELFLDMLRKEGIKHG